MRANLLLATVFAFLGFVLGLLFFILVNVQIPIEPFSTWSGLPYANMFQYAGLVCLLGAVIYLLMERQESSD
jgi:NhaP-type Na+/H+ or K+/H+ antiporter